MPAVVGFPPIDSSGRACEIQLSRNKRVESNKYRGRQPLPVKDGWIGRKSTR
jgi:hypothetical protein